MEDEMTARHTPGPWRKCIGFFSDGRAIVDAGRGTSDVAWIPHRHEDSPHMDEVRDANARLIAAAPLLFSALQRIVRNGYLVDDVPDDVLNHALQALEQVEGDE
jgi:hypothetical protein